LGTLAEIFAVQNFWQLINAAVSGAPTASMEAKDLVRVYPAGRHGKNGQCLLQVREKNVLLFSFACNVHVCLEVLRCKNIKGLKKVFFLGRGHELGTCEWENF